MSGFEIVGVVLGAVPLIILYLEHYRDLNRKRDIFFKRSEHIKRMINALNDQQVLIEGDVEHLLRSADVDVLGEIKTDNLTDLFKQDDIKEEIQAILGTRRCAVYLETLRTCEETLVRIAKAIGSLKQGPWADNGSLEEMLKINNPTNAGHEFRKRWKFTMNKDELAASIQELDRATQNLARVRVLGLSVNEQVLQSPSRRSSKIIGFLQHVRNRASSLHCAIASRWSKPCHNSHCARMKLDHRLASFKSNVGKLLLRTSTIDFNVIFEASELSGQSFHHPIVIEASDANVPDVSSPISTNITFRCPVQPTSVTDVCQAISDTLSAHKAIKLYLDHDHRLGFSAELPVSTSATVQSSDFVGLADLLKLSNEEFQIQHRIHIAATIASSMMQLYSTPWLQRMRKESFLFRFKTTCRQGYDVGQPIVCCSFTDKNELFPRQADYELLDLGILIIELWRNQTIESFCAINNVPLQDNYDSRQCAARRWLNEDEGQFVRSVFEAAFRCVECRFSSMRLGLNDESVRQMVFEGVVNPLWENCRH